jgi:hypothetical protein
MAPLRQAYTVGNQPAIVILRPQRRQPARPCDSEQGSNTLDLINQANGTFAPASPIQTGASPCVERQAALSTPLRQQLHVINAATTRRSPATTVPEPAPSGNQPADPRVVATTDLTPTRSGMR